MMLKIAAAMGVIAAPLFVTPALAMNPFECRGDGCKWIASANPVLGAVAAIGDQAIARASGEHGSQGLPGGPIGEPANPAPAPRYGYAPQMGYMPPPPPPPGYGGFTPVYMPPPPPPVGYGYYPMAYPAPY